MLAPPPTKELTTAYEPWFDELVAMLRAHQVQLETGTASDATTAWYQQIMSGDINSLMYANKQVAQRFFVSRILLDYVKRLSETNVKKLAFQHNDSEVLVWAEIQDDDEVAERQLILAEAFVNNAYHRFGFDVTTTIVETRDLLPIPNHYRQAV